MLVLTRKLAEEVLFPDLGVSVRVVRIARGRVRLGIEAPPSLQILRGELVDHCRQAMTRSSENASARAAHDLRGRLNSARLEIEYLRNARLKGIAIDEESVVDRVLDYLDRAKDCLDTVQPAVPKSAGILRSIRLLVVDDNEHERNLLKSILLIQGFQVDEATDGDEALKQLGSESLPDAILLDLQMPRLNGEHTLRGIRCDERLRNLRVIGMSGFLPLGHVLPDGVRGFDAWIDKPLNVDRLVSLIRESANATSSNN